MSAVIDTNVLIYDTFEDSALHSEAKNKLDGLKRWHVPMIVIHEYIWFMKGEDIDLSLTKDKVLEYVTHEKTEIVSEDADEVLFAIERIKSYRDYNDYLILASARRFDEPLLTFDHRLKEVAARIGVNVI